MIYSQYVSLCTVLAFHPYNSRLISLCLRTKSDREDGSFKRNATKPGAHQGASTLKKKNIFKQGQLQFTFPLLVDRQHSASPKERKVENVVRQKHPDYREGSLVWSYKTTDRAFHGPNLKVNNTEKPPAGSSR